MVRQGGSMTQRQIDQIQQHLTAFGQNRLGFGIDRTALLILRQRLVNLGQGFHRWHPQTHATFVLDTQQPLLVVLPFLLQCFLVQRDMGDFLLLLEVFNLFAHEDEVRVMLRAGLMAIQQLLHERTQAEETTMSHRTYLVPGQGLVQSAFANIFHGVERRKFNVRLDAAILGAVTGDAVEFGVGQFYLAMLDRLQCLHRTFAESTVADNDATVVVLDGAGKDFRCRGAEPVDDHGHGAIPGNLRIEITQNVHPSRGVTDLNRRAALNKQAHQLVGFTQRAATVVAQIHNQAIDLFGTQFMDQFFHVAGSAFIVGIAVLQRFEIDVEGRNLDNAQFEAALVTVEFQYPLAGGLLFKLDLVALDLDNPAGLTVHGIGRNHFKPDQCALGAANLADHIVQTHADHIFDNTVLALADPHDDIRRFQLPGFIGRTGRYEAYHFCLVIFRLQYGADPFQRKAHVDLKVFRPLGRKVLGVRIKFVGQRVDEAFEYIVTLGLFGTLLLVLIATQQNLFGFLDGFVCQLQAQQGTFQLFAPELLHLRFGFDPGSFGAVGLQYVVTLEVPVVIVIL